MTSLVEESTSPVESREDRPDQDTGDTRLHTTGDVDAEAAGEPGDTRLHTSETLGVEFTFLQPVFFFP
jgi:hypothetical protein